MDSSSGSAHESSAGPRDVGTSSISSDSSRGNRAAAASGEPGGTPGGCREDPQQFLLFVYGTLKRGQPNEAVMRDKESGQATLIGRGITDEKWPLVIASRYNVPYLLNVPGSGHVSTADAARGAGKVCERERR